MIIFYMHIFIKIFILTVLFSHTLFAKEPFLARLVNVVTNDIQEFEVANTRFTCAAYGIIAIDEIYRRAEEGSTCKKSIAKFYKKRADLRHFISRKLHIYQYYSLLRKENNRCAINIAGEKTLSEFLIEEGLAVKKPLFKDREYSYYFYRSEQNAKDKSKGIWKENIVKNCMEYIDTSDK